MKIHDFPAGAVLFCTGDPATHAYLIREGSLELLRGALDQPARLALLGPGEVVGEMSLVEDRPHGLTARAVTAVKVTALTREEFELVLTADPATFRVYLRTLFERLRSLSAQAGGAVVATPATAMPSVTLYPLTPRTAETLPREGLAITKYPFRIGRADPDNPDALDLNDLFLPDRAPYNVSRTHALLDLQEGMVVIQDRGSHLGLYVNQVHVGGHSAAQKAELKKGDNVVIFGGHSSPFRFRIHVEPG